METVEEADFGGEPDNRRFIPVQDNFPRLFKLKALESSVLVIKLLSPPGALPRA